MILIKKQIQKTDHPISKEKRTEMNVYKKKSTL